MNRITAELLCGFVAFCGAIFSSYACWRKLSPDALRETDIKDEVRYRRRIALGSNIPVLTGYVCGLVALLVLSRYVLPGDRFYPTFDALIIALVPLGPGLAFVAIDLAFPPRIFAGRRKFTGPESGSTTQRTVCLLVLLIASAVTGSMLGVQFPLLSLGREQVFELGEYSTVTSMVWLVVATLIVKLLDGLDGAAPVLLLVCAAAVFYTTSSSLEYFLNTFSVILIGTVLGSLRFHMYPARLSLRGGGSLFLGFLFAVLTVLARQKSVTTGLIIAPLLLAALLVAGAMLGFLERNLLLRKDEQP